ncbi:MAG: two pore domain potassium channel family protein [Alistipes sp.]|nr:two pore domain potassium channel family protein [Alistipes sp.]MBQ8544549.1 two pore domain potassium channel family protein [Alistipes sp.]MBR3703372.1 two pore domain potassium channel family protein [Alistipes sp.]
MKNDNTFARLINLIAGVALLVGISIEVLTGDHQSYSAWYMWLQLAVCIIFMIDFAAAMMATDKNSRRWFWLNLLFFLISIPYLNILSWLNVVPHRGVAIAVAALPLLRSFVAMGVVVWWFIAGKVSRIFVAYLFTVVCFTYLAALIFYDYEVLVNEKLHGFGNAFWWAWMNTTTVGAAIFPVTTIGKVLAVLLPSLGMMFFPIFTIYVTNIYNVKAGKNKK